MEPTTGSSSLQQEASLQTTYLAATRTLLAVLRTGSAIAGGGALVTNLLVTGWPRWVVVVLSSAFVFLGYWVMWSALKKGRKLRARLELERAGMEFLFPHRDMALLTWALQFLIATVVVLYLIGR